jgi:dipeptidyl aminopeptidase/acylaminoacyl peptidase
MRRAFSLAEVLLSLGSLALVLVMAVGVLHFSLYSGRRGDHALRAALLAQEKLAWAERAPLARLTSGRFPAPWEAYSYSFSQTAGAPGLVRLTVWVKGPAGAQARLVATRRAHPRDVILTVRDQGRWRLARVREEGGSRQLLPSTGGDDTQPTLSPDGSVVCFVSTQGGQGLGLWMMPADGSAPPRRCSGVPMGASAPSFGPSGHEVALVAPDAQAISQLFVLRMGGSCRQVTHGRDSVTGPSWSPQGGQLAVGLGSSTLALVDGSGAPTVLLEGQGWNSAPSFSPDGQWLAFMSNRDGNPEIYRMRVSGSSPERLTHDPGYDIHPRWSSDGLRLVFQSQQGGAQRIWTMNADGSDLRMLGRPEDEQAQPSQEPEGEPTFIPAPD